MTIVLGTAQFGMDYGVANHVGRPADEALAETLACFAANGGTTLDTAVNYGDCEARLGHYGVSNFNVITKLPDLASYEDDFYGATRQQLEASMTRLGLNNLYGVMLHRPKNLQLDKGDGIWRAVLDMQKEGLVQKFGYSLYNPDELDELFVSFRPSIVQLPFNVFDQRFATTGWLKRLSASGCEVHSRSAFLQGVLLQSANDRPTYFDNWHFEFDRFDRFVASAGATPMHIALSFVFSQNGIDGVVVGVDTAQQLEEILQFRQLKVKEMPDLAVQDTNLILPQNWQLI